MPSPVLPNDIASTVPSVNADFCEKIKLVFLRLPKLLSVWWAWAMNADGTFTSAFKDAAGSWRPGDIKGSIVSTPDMGWLSANGQEVSRTTYAALFLEIGTTYGEGNGSTTFTLPDFRGRFLYGVSSTKPLHTVGGSETHTLSINEMPAHTHPMSSKLYGALVGGTLNEKPQHNGNQNTGSTGGGQAHNNLPPYETVFWYVKY